MIWNASLNIFITALSAVVTVLVITLNRSKNIFSLAFKVSALEAVVVFVAIFTFTAWITYALQGMFAPADYQYHALSSGELSDALRNALCVSILYVGLPNFFLAYAAKYLLDGMPRRTSS